MTAAAVPAAPEGAMFLLIDGRPSVVGAAPRRALFLTCIITGIGMRRSAFKAALRSSACDQPLRPVLQLRPASAPAAAPPARRDGTIAMAWPSWPFIHTVSAGNCDAGIGVLPGRRAGTRAMQPHLRPASSRVGAAVDGARMRATQSAGSNVRPCHCPSCSSSKRKTRPVARPWHTCRTSRRRCRARRLPSPRCACPAGRTSACRGQASAASPGTASCHNRASSTLLPLA